MKIIKPLKMGLLHKTYSFKFEHHFVAAPILFFKLSNSNENDSEVLVENEQWPLIQEALGNDILDMVMPKPKAEYLIAGQAYNPEPEGLTSFKVGVEVAGKYKGLTISGDRQWEKRFLGYNMSDAQNIEAIPLTMANAFGGEGFADNVDGKGYFKKDKENHFLPNIETIGEEVTSRSQKPAPAGFGQLPITHSQRAKYNGDYSNQEWLEKHFPNLAPDTDMRLFQAARSEQQFDGFLQGGESYTLINLHPEMPEISGNIPALKARTFVMRAGELIEIPLNLDTLWFFPDKDIGAMIFHGQLQVQDMDGADITSIMIAYESLNDEARPLAYYESVYKERTDPETAMLVAMDQSQLSPIKTEEQILQEQKELEEEIAEQQAILDEQHEQTIEDIKEANNGKLPQGFEPAAAGTAAVLISSAAIARGDFNAKALMAEAEKQKKLAEEQQLGLDSELADIKKQSDQVLKSADPKAIKEMEKNTSINEQIASVKEMAAEKQIALDDEQLEQLESQQLMANQYAMTPLSEWPEDELAQEKRAIFVAAVTANESLNNRDWTGCDLSGLDLSGKDLSGCILENCNLENTQFVASTLNKTAFTGSKLVSTSFQSASLNEANFSSTVGENNNFTNSSLEKAFFVKSQITNSLFEKCQLQESVFMDSSITGCQFSESQFKQTSFVNCNLSDTDFVSVEAQMLCLMQSQLNFGRWTGAQLTRCAFLECEANVSNFAESKFNKCQLSGGTKLNSGVFINADWQECGLRRVEADVSLFTNAKLNQCDLGDSSFTQSDFSDAKLIQSVLSESDFSQSNFERANFYTGLMRKTQLHDCQLKDANFLECDAIFAEVYGSNYDAALNVAPVTQRRWQDADRNAA